MAILGRRAVAAVVALVAGALALVLGLPGTAAAAGGERTFTLSGDADDHLTHGGSYGYATSGGGLVYATRRTAGNATRVEVTDEGTVVSTGSPSALASLTAVSDLDGVVRALMRDVGTALRPLGFRGSGGTWRLLTPHGAGVVSRQASRCSTRDAKPFFLNTAVVPTVWWEWKNGPSAGIEKAREVDGIRLLERRVEWSDQRHGDGASSDVWCVTARTDVEAFRADLVDRVTASARRAAALLEPGRYLDELRALPVKQVAHREALVVLLADGGAPAELEDAFVGLRAAFADRPRAAEHAERLVAWARDRAASRSA